MSVESALRDRLLSDATVAATVGDRVYPTLADQGTRAPYIVYTRVTARHEYSLAGPSNLARASYQIDCYAGDGPDKRGSDAAIDLGDAVRDLLHARPWSADGVAYAPIVETERDLPDEESRLHRRTLEVAIWY